MNTTTTDTREAAFNAYRTAQDEMKNKLRSLPGHVGLKDVPALINALKRLNAKTAGRGHRLNEATRAAIEADLKAGVPGATVMERYHVSLPTVYLMKKALKLVKPHRPLNRFTQQGLVNRLKAGQKDTHILKELKGVSISQLRKIKDSLGLIKTRKPAAVEAQAAK